MADAKRNAAALAVLDKIAGYSWSINEYGRALAALPELAALYRAGVEMRRCDRDATTIGTGEFGAAFRAFDAALAAVADKLNGEGK